MNPIALLTTFVFMQTALPPATLEKLRAGEVIVREESKPGVTGSFTVAQVLVEAPPQKIWKLVADCANYSKRMPRILKSSASDHQGEKDFGNGSMKCTVTTDLPMPFSDLTSTSQVQLRIEPEKKTWVREWHMVEGDYEYQEGSWTLWAMDEGQKTLVTYRVRLKPKVALPDWILKAAQDRTVPDMMRGLRKRNWNEEPTP